MPLFGMAFQAGAFGLKGSEQEKLAFFPPPLTTKGQLTLLKRAQQLGTFSPSLAMGLVTGFRNKGERQRRMQSQGMGNEIAMEGVCCLQVHGQGRFFHVGTQKGGGEQLIQVCHLFPVKLMAILLNQPNPHAYPKGQPEQQPNQKGAQKGMI
jgi:hypothetical protein